MITNYLYVLLALQRGGIPCCPGATVATRHAGVLKREANCTRPDGVVKAHVTCSMGSAWLAAGA
jgi:hypothetical protein